jgi:alpha-1,3-mannosyltransferase
MRQVVDRVRDVLQQNSSLFIVILLIFELIINIVIISKVNYTEIDWVAYMQEVGFFLDGERNYRNMYGDTGPLVYPAGFVYVFSALKWATADGTNILGGNLFSMLSTGNRITDRV